MSKLFSSFRKKKNTTTENGVTTVQHVTQSVTETRKEASYTRTASFSSKTVGISSASGIDSRNFGNLFDVEFNRLKLSSTSDLPTSPRSRALLPSTTTKRSHSLFETDAKPIYTLYNQTPTSKITPSYQNPYVKREPSSAVVSTTPLRQRTSAYTTNDIPTYKTEGSNRGNALIINNIKFLNDQERKGADIDGTTIQKLWRDMGFNVKYHKNLKVDDMKSKIKKFARDDTLKNVDISIVVIMSHGTNRNDKNQLIPGNYTQIIGTDGTGLSIDDVLAEFSTEKCTGMIGKPKIFFFQCCRGDQQETPHVDAVPFKVQKHSDMLIAFSTLPGFYSLRDPIKGSWYIQSICDVFRKHANVHHVESLLKMVNDELSKKHPGLGQTSTYESRGFKQCYLNPKYPNLFR